ncbi:hypothetical protein C8F04DRAFT_951224 [Mycena alexandri]|nr:hypothetical protein C8F04DRAFT_951224 [Mycena alexandri]
MPPCTVCRKATSQKCARCGTAFYCTAEHQKSDWKTHKYACVAPARSLATAFKTRAEAEHDGDTKFAIDAILLPCDDDAPRFVKLVCETYTDSDDDILPAGFKHHREDLDPYLGPHHNTFYKSIPISSMGYTGPALGHTITLRWRDTFLEDGSVINRSIIKLTNGKAYHPWGGNLIA